MPESMCIQPPLFLNKTAYPPPKSHRRHAMRQDSKQGWGFECVIRPALPRHTHSGPDPTTPPMFLQLPAITPLPPETFTRPLALLEESEFGFDAEENEIEGPVEAVLGIVAGDSTRILGDRLQRYRHCLSRTGHPRASAVQHAWAVRLALPYRRT